MTTPPNSNAEAEQRAEIDNFLSLLDSVRADAKETTDARGTIALVGASAHGPRAGGDAAGLLREAHGFLKLNLRRPDSVAFYGPTLLFVYLPGRESSDTRAALARLFGEFESSRTNARLLLGLASFPGDGAGVEQLIELAEQRLESARAVDATPSRVANGAAADEEKRLERPSVEEQRGERPPAPAATRASRMLDALNASTRSLLGERGPAEATRGDLSTRRAPARAETGHDESALAGALPHRLLLVVSDASLMVRLNLLLRSAGVEVRAAFDARQALGLLRVERPDLLVVDNALSDMDGVEMLRRLALASGGRLTRPAVLLVAESGGSDGEEASKIGAHVVASVPYNPAEILEAISAVGGQLHRE